MIQPFSRQTDSGWRLLIPKQLSAGSGRSAMRASRNQSAGSSPRQSLQYLPSKTPIPSISAGVKRGAKPGMKPRPGGAAIS